MQLFSIKIPALSFLPQRLACNAEHLSYLLLCIDALIFYNELSGVFNWVLQGLYRLLEQKKFSDCEAAQRAVEQYKIESNSVQMFLSENEYKASPTNYRLIKNLYQEYRTFCLESGMPPFKKVNFVKQLRNLNFIVERVSQNQLAVFIENTEESF